MEVENTEPESSGSPEDSGNSETVVSDGGVDPHDPSPFAHMILLTIVVLAVGVAAITLADHSAASRRLPFGTFAVLATLLLAQFIAVGVKLKNSTSNSSRGRKHLRKDLYAIAWIVALGFSLYVIGLIPGALVFITAYLATYRPIKWYWSIVLIVTFGLFVQIVFIEMLNLPIPDGLLFQ